MLKFVETLYDDPSKVTLRPSGVTALLIAPTASGKTTLTAQFAAKDAAKLLNLTIGESSSTIIDRHLVYTSALEHHMIVSVKQKNPLVSVLDFTDRIASQLVDFLVNTNKKFRFIDVPEIEAEVKKDLKRVFSKTMNTHAEYSLLTQDVLEKAINDLTSPIAFFLKSNGLKIYNNAANILDAAETVKNSKKIRDVVKTKLQEFVQTDSDIKDALQKVHNRLDSSLKEHFYSFFDERNKTADDYYFNIIDVNDVHQHKNFILSFFTNNNVHKGSKLSVEVLCDEIVIHLPMEKSILESIKVGKQQHQKRSVYEDFNQQHVSFTLIDTQGLFHEASNEELEKERLRQMLYNTRYDSLICLNPIFGNSNDAKYQLLLSQEMSRYKKNVPVFFLSNKADQYADSLRKNEFSATEAFDDLFNDTEISSPKLNVLERVFTRANEAAHVFRVALEERKQGQDYVIPVMFKEPVNEDDRDELAKKCGPSYVINEIISKIETNLLQASSFIKFEYHGNMGWSQRPFEVNTRHLVDCLSDTWMKAEIINQIKKPALDNIDKNMGLRPHGNGFNALIVRLKKGEGWDSNIRTDYFKHHDSFHIRFPANLANLLSSELIANLVNEAVEYSGNFDKEGKDKFITSIIQCFTWGKNQFVADVLYHQTFIKAWSTNYSNKAVFNEFLKQSELIFEISPEQYDLYLGHLPFENQHIPQGTEELHKIVTALQKQLEEVLTLVFNMYVYKD